MERERERKRERESESERKRERERKGERDEEKKKFDKSIHITVSSLIPRQNERTNSICKILG